MSSILAMMRSMVMVATGSTAPAMAAWTELPQDTI
jgi:hypothetical protein